MSNWAFCIFCDSLQISESILAGSREEVRYEYYCYDCGESWSDDESEFETGL